MIFKRYIAGLLLLSLLAGCSLLQRQAPSQVLAPLPPIELLSCCWQQQAALSLQLPGQAPTPLQLIALRRNDSLQLLGLSAIGQRLLGLEYRADKLTETLTPPGWRTALSHQLLLGLALDKAAPDALAGKADWLREGWSLRVSKMDKSVFYQDKAYLTIEQRGADRRRLQLHDSGAIIDIRILSVQSL